MTEVIGETDSLKGSRKWATLSVTLHDHTDRGAASKKRLLSHIR